MRHLGTDPITCPHRASSSHWEPRVAGSGSHRELSGLSECSSLIRKLQRCPSLTLSIPCACRHSVLTVYPSEVQGDMVVKGSSSDRVMGPFSFH